jgi:glyoxylase-like metal-dependent hydrolase (beta-lactamase superfamily II)
VVFRIEHDEEIGPRLRALGIGPRDVKRVVLTHLHADHDGGLAHFPQTEILVSRGELRTASGWMGRMRGYLPNRWPTWFDPAPLDLTTQVFGPFAASRRLTAAGDVVAVATPGHTADHVSVVVEDQETTYFLAGATLRAISQFAKDRPTVYLPTHDPESAVRLAGRRLTIAGP